MTIQEKVEAIRKIIGNPAAVQIVKVKRVIQQ